MRGEQILNALKFIGHKACEIADFIDFIVTPENTKSNYLGLRYGYSRQRKRYSKTAFEPTEENRLMARAYRMIYRLKKDGLIKKERLGKKSILEITKKGREKEKLLSTPALFQLPPASYKSEPADILVIISFDVPEKEKRKRDWLRAVLKRLELKMMQKSVWIGKIKIPEEFIDDLKQLRIIDYVEIFAVTKAGTISHIA